MPAKFSFQRLGDGFFLLIPVLILPMLLWAQFVGMVLLICTFVFLSLGTVCALLGGWQQKASPWSRIGVGILTFFVLAVLAPIVAAAQ